MARLQAHPRPGGTHLLPLRPHHPGGLGTVQDMPPPYGQGQTSGLVPGGNPTRTRRLASPQPRAPGHQTPPQGSPDQEGHYERGGDTGPATAPHRTRGGPDGGSSALPARRSPQSSGPNGTPPKASCLHKRSNAPTPAPEKTCCLSSITMQCMTQKSTNLLHAPHTPPISVRSPPRHHQSTPEDHAPQDPPATSTRDTPRPSSHPGDHPAPPSPDKPAKDHPQVCYSQNVLESA